MNRRSLQNLYEFGLRLFWGLNYFWREMILQTQRRLSCYRKFTPDNNSHWQRLQSICKYLKIYLQSGVYNDITNRQSVNLFWINIVQGINLSMSSFIIHYFLTNFYYNSVYLYIDSCFVFKHNLGPKYELYSTQIEYISISIAQNSRAIQKKSKFFSLVLLGEKKYMCIHTYIYHEHHKKWKCQVYVNMKNLVYRIIKTFYFFFV